MSDRGSDVASPTIQSDQRRLLRPPLTGEGSSPHAGNGEEQHGEHVSQGGGGLGVLSTSFFILTGVLFTIPLPYALKQTGMYSGVMLMVTLPALMIYMAIILGRCWIMLLERWPDRYQGVRTRRPFPSIAREAGGHVWEKITIVSVDAANIGVTIVDLLVAAAALETLVPHQISFRYWLLICTAVTMPFVWLGSPMDTWMVGWGGGLVGMLASVCLLVAVVVGGSLPPVAAAGGASIWNATATTAAATASTLPVAPLQSAFTLDVTFGSFWLGASTQIFTYAGMSIFPSLQHDMKEPRRWPQAIGLSYVFIAVFALATAVSGLQLFGPLTNANVLLNVDCQGSVAASVLAKLCSVLYILVSLCNGIVGILPVTQDVEELFKLPAKQNYKHILVRTTVMLLCLAAAEAIPHFDKFISLIGATAISVNNFILPPLFYYWLSVAGGETFGLHYRTFFVEVIFIGAVSALVGTYAAVSNIVHSSPPNPC